MAMSMNCNCTCNNGSFTTIPNCKDSFPECRETNPCSEIISDLCVIHNPNGIYINIAPESIIIPENINIHSFIQLLSMYNDANLSQYVLTSNSYGPILGLRTVFVGTDTFKIRWDFPNVPDPATQQTKFKIIVREYANQMNVAGYLIDSTINSFTVYNYGTIVYGPGKTYMVKVELVEQANPLNVLTSSINILVTTKQ